MTPEQAQTLVGREFVHFKGKRYRLVAVAKHSETLEPIVVYRALYGEGGVWVRPFAMFFEDVDRDGYRGPRFRLAEDVAHGSAAGVSVRRLSRDERIDHPPGDGTGRRKGRQGIRGEPSRFDDFGAVRPEFA